jgi:acetate---CoA ligase (ADP-forming) subunit beta
MPLAQDVTQIIAKCIQAAQAEGRSALLEPEGKQILCALGFDVPNGVVVKADNNLVLELRHLRPPYAIKAVSAQVIHKSDFGAVKLGLPDPETVEQARNDIQGALLDRGINADTFLVEEMAQPGVELVIGGLIDPEFGPMIMLGLGGIFVEIYKDVVFRICPIDASDASDMVESLAAVALLKGARGRKAVNLDCIKQCLLLLGGEDGLMMSKSMPFSEIDINPFIANATGAVAVDARFILKLNRDHHDSTN